MDLRTKRGKFEAFLQRRLNNATHFLHLHKEQILEQTAKSYSGAIKQISAKHWRISGGKPSHAKKRLDDPYIRGFSNRKFSSVRIIYSFCLFHKK